MVELPVIVDIHTHIGRLPGVVGEVVTAEDLLYIQEHEGVALMLVSSASSNTVSMRVGSTEMHAMLREHSQHLKGMVWINPHDPEWPELVNQVASENVVGIKLHPVLDHYAVEMRALDDVFALARKRGWPVLTHTDVDGTPMSAMRYEPLIRAYPDVVLILAHLRLEALPLARRFENVFLDTTYVEAPMVEIGLAVVGAGKLLFGTDAAEGFDVGHALGRIRPRRSYADIVVGLRLRGIGDADLVRICSENALALFDLR